MGKVKNSLLQGYLSAEFPRFFSKSPKCSIFVLRKWFLLAISPDFSSIIENSCDVFAEWNVFGFVFFKLFLIFHFTLSQG